MATLTITTKYSDQTPLPESYIFRITGMEEDLDKERQLKRLGYRYDTTTKAWWKKRYADSCNQKQRNELIEKLREVEPGITVVWDTEGEEI